MICEWVNNKKTCVFKFLVAVHSTLYHWKNIDRILGGQLLWCGFLLFLFVLFSGKILEAERKRKEISKRNSQILLFIHLHRLFESGSLIWSMPFSLEIKWSFTFRKTSKENNKITISILHIGSWSENVWWHIVSHGAWSCWCASTAENVAGSATWWLKDPGRIKKKIKWLTFFIIACKVIHVLTPKNIHRTKEAFLFLHRYLHSKKHVASPKLSSWIDKYARSTCMLGGLFHGIFFLFEYNNFSV